MRRTKFLLIFIVMAIIAFLSGCAGLTGPEQGALIKITARRIAFQGFKSNPDLFTSMGEIAKESCQGLSDQAQPSDIAFKVIVETICTKTKDPLLAQDLKDVVRLLGIKFDASFQLVGITPERLKFIHLFLCSFSHGVEAAQQTTK